MKNMRRTLWLLLFSQVIFLFSSLLEPPTTWLMIILRVVVPFLGVIYRLHVSSPYPVKKRVICVLGHTKMELVGLHLQKGS